MQLSLILATVGRSEDVRQALHSLATQTDQNFEVLLVDQNPDDRLVPYVNEMVDLRLNIRHIRMKSPSLSGARNLGIAESQGEIVGFPDDDCWYEPEAIANLRAVFTNTQKIDGIVANWVEQSAAHSANQSEKTLSHQSWRRFRGGDASSISLFIKTSLLRQIDGFDERMGVGQWFGAAEETDLILRILATGAVIQRASNVRIHHAFGTPPQGDLSLRCENARKRSRGTGAIYAKHRLSIYTIVRGLAAPLLRPLIHWTGRAKFAVGLATSQGRLEGLIRWGWGKS